MSILDEDKSLFGESTSEINDIMDEYPGTLLVIGCDTHCGACLRRDRHRWRNRITIQLYLLSVINVIVRPR